MESKLEVCKFNADVKNFPIRFSVGSISAGFSDTESGEISLNGNVYDFSAEYSSIDISDVLNIKHKSVVISI